LIREVIQGKPAIAHQSLKHQFKKLIIESILVVRNTIFACLARRKPLVIIIDALNECDDKDLMAEFILVVIGAFQENHQLPFRVIVASRVEEHIRQKLETPAAHSVMHRSSLQDFDSSMDICKFFQSSFSTIYDRNTLLLRYVPCPWPSESEITTLIEKSDGLFIFAITLMNFIHSGGDLPQDNLQRALAAEPDLDALYEQILSAAVPNHHFKQVIGTIMLLSESLSISSLRDLLRL
jgi:hypothetical protein